MLRNPRVRIGLVLMLVGLVTFGAKKWLANRSKQAGFGPKGPAQVDVVVAKADIPPQSILSADPNLIGTEPMAAKEAGAYLTKAKFDEIMGKKQGLVTKYPVIRDYPIPMTAIAGVIEELGISYLIPQNKRAMILELSKSPNFYEMIKSTDHVDIIATYLKGDQPAYVRTIVQDAIVLATNTMIDPFTVAQRGPNSPEAQQAQQAQQAKAGAKSGDQTQQQPPPPPPPNITIALSPQDAMLVALSAKATLDVILRPQPGVGFGESEGGYGTTPGTGETGTGEAGTPPTGHAAAIEPGIPIARTRSLTNIASLPKGIAMTDLVPPDKTAQASGGGGQPARPPRANVPALPPAPRRTGPVPPMSTAPIIPMGPMAPLPSSNTYEIQVFTGSSRSSVPVKKPAT